MNKKFYWLAGFAALMMTAACSDDNVTNPNPDPTPDPETEENVVTLQVLDGASQADRIQMVVPTKAVGGVKKNRLNYVATIKNPKAQAADRVWSTTSIYIENEKNTEHTVYITWHSDRQATNPAQVWGGQLDVVGFNETGDNTSTIDIESSVLAQNVMKFENVMKVDDVTFYNPNGEVVAGNNWGLFLSATHATKGAVVARIPGFGMSRAEILGMPGTSVNAVAELDGELIAVTGYNGTYATFDPSAKSASYSYEHPERNTWLTLGQELTAGFGGKYVTTYNGEAYILHTDAEKAQIIKASDNSVVVDNMKPLLSDDKFSESYDPVTGDWFVNENGASTPTQGKHVMVIKDGYAYVGAGLNGLRVYNLANGQEVAQDDFEDGGPNTTGLCIDDDLLYAATGSGLRVYSMLDGGKLSLYAFEVAEYDENGLPNSDDVPTTGVEEGEPILDEDGNVQQPRHSANYVAVLTTTTAGDKYIFVAYGQSGVRVYKLIPNVGDNVGGIE